VISAKRNVELYLSEHFEETYAVLDIASDSGSTCRFVASEVASDVLDGGLFVNVDKRTLHVVSHEGVAW
jgi:hypothetical protein